MEARLGGGGPIRSPGKTPGAFHLGESRGTLVNASGCRFREGRENVSKEKRFPSLPLYLQNSSAKSVFQLSHDFVGDVRVGVDVLDIVIVLQRVNELLHIFNVPCVSELHIVLGYHFHLGGGKDIALPL